MVLLFGMFIRQQKKRNNMGQELIISTQSSDMDFLLYFLFIMVFSMFFLFIKKYTKSKKSISLFIINLLFFYFLFV
ncbi:hypothetical protein BA1DRAFT_03951 [Photorhabdus aegyptia]|uniref:Uncharacterized protein n=1 Tax=Photorhabdus aegyptia TaxID=2805098 RepID=A0A022PGH3_9GAMM|nr:hypothetical protein BA1DRAFT_03951 [Photorhabdus aegyptia]